MKRVSWTAMIVIDRQDTVITLNSYDIHEDRALKSAPIASKAFVVREGHDCEGGKGLLQQLRGLAPKRTEYF